MARCSLANICRYVRRRRSADGDPGASHESRGGGAANWVVMQDSSAGIGRWGAGVESHTNANVLGGAKCWGGSIGSAYLEESWNVRILTWVACCPILPHCIAMQDRWEEEMRVETCVESPKFQIWKLSIGKSHKLRGWSEDFWAQSLLYLDIWQTSNTYWWGDGSSVSTDGPYKVGTGEKERWVSGHMILGSRSGGIPIVELGEALLCCKLT